MRGFNRPHIVKKILFNQISFALFGLLILIAIGYPLAKNVKKQYGVNNEMKELEQEISKMENKNLELKQLIDYLGSDQFAQEQARLNLNYKKEGEEVVVINDQGSGGSQGGAEGGGNKNIYDVSGKDKIAPPPAIGNPTKWRRYFFK